MRAYAFNQVLIIQVLIIQALIILVLGFFMLLQERFYKSDKLAGNLTFTHITFIHILTRQYTGVACNIAPILKGRCDLSVL